MKSTQKLECQYDNNQDNAENGDEKASEVAIAETPRVPATVKQPKHATPPNLTGITPNTKQTTSSAQITPGLI